MIELKVPLWKLLAQGAGMYLLAVFMMRGHRLKRRLKSNLAADK